MRETPILFSAPMVRAILAGKKTMTRRLLSYQRDWPGRVELRDGKLLYYPSAPAFPARRAEPALSAPSRYAVGDRLWVKETFAWADQMAEGVEREDPVCVSYRADQTAIAHEHENVHALDTSGWNWDRFKWRPSIFMPRWASRLTLEVTAVRVERLQNITEADARAEGVDELDGEIDELKLCEYAKHMGSCSTDGKVWFAVLWDAINGKRAAWASNPWVAVVSFKPAPAGPVDAGRRGT